MRSRSARIQFSLALVGGLGLAAAGCGDDAVAGEFNGCADGDFVDRTAASAARTVGYGGAAGSGLFAYSPKCIRIAAGQAVTFTGGTTSSFGVHPLAPGALNSPAAGTAGNPIPRLSNGTQRDVTVTFPAAGTFPYICEAHAASGMVGVVQVR